MTFKKCNKPTDPLLLVRYYIPSVQNHVDKYRHSYLSKDSKWPFIFLKLEMDYSWILEILLKPGN